ncbi:hypothetical protein YC2023_020891 [Brassica napus]
MMKWAEEKDNVLTSSLVSFVPSVSELLFIFLYKLVTLLSHMSSGGASEDEKPNDFNSGNTIEHTNFITIFNS